MAYERDKSRLYWRFRGSVQIPGSSRMVGGDSFSIMAGPCAVESQAQLSRIAKKLRKAGVRFLRGGAFKPRTSPHVFQGLGEEGLRILRTVADENNMSVVTEIMDIRDIPLFEKYDIEILQVGARNMQNFSLLKELGKLRRPVLLKRSFGALLDELLLSAEYLLAGGNKQVILCERGIRTFETDTRTTLDLSAVPALRARTKLPIIVDPSHSSGRPDIIPAMMRAITAVGADGLLVEVHDRAHEALCDGQQALTIPRMKAALADVKKIAKVVKKRMQ